MLIYLQMIESDEDKSKFEQLYLLYRGLMFAVAMRILHHEQDAEDAVHQAFLSIIEHLGKISVVNCPKTRAWVVIIVERKALDIVRTKSRHPKAEFDDATIGLTIPLQSDDSLANAMARLPAHYREALLLRYDIGYNVRDIAQMLNIKPGSVQKLLYRAKKALEQLLEEEERENAKL